MGVEGTVAVEEAGEEASRDVEGEAGVMRTDPGPLLLLRRVWIWPWEPHN